MSWCKFAAFVVALSLVTMARSAEPEPRRLTTDGLVKTSPTFIGRSGPDSNETELIYVVEDLATRMRLMRLRPSDLTTVPLHPDETRSEFEPTCSSDGRLVSFIQSRGNLNLVLVIQELASKKEVVVSVGGGFSGPRSPAFTADGTRVVYSFAEEGRQCLFNVSAEGGESRKIVDSSGQNNWPAFSPDGKQLAFGSSRDADTEIYLANVDGTNPRRLTTTPGLDARPRFSPDGRRICFTSNRDGNYEIYVMNADGTDQRRLTNHPERDDYPTWHPDGKRLVFVGERSGKHDLYEIAVP